MRRQNQGLIDKGKADGVKPGDVFEVVKKGRIQTAHNGIALVYSSDDVVGRLSIENIDEEVASGMLERNGFFDRIENGDEIILQKETSARTSGDMAANPELRTLLRTLR
jgi:hypothetical protein